MFIFFKKQVIDYGRMFRSSTTIGKKMTLESFSPQRDLAIPDNLCGSAKRLRVDRINASLRDQYVQSVSINPSCDPVWYCADHFTTGPTSEAPV